MSLPARLLSSAIALLLLPVPAVAQTLRDGLDAPAEVTELTTESFLRLNEAPLPSGEWRHEQADSHDGTDSVASVLPNGAESILRAKVQGPAIVSFWWKVEAIAYFDRLQCYTGTGFVGSLVPPPDPDMNLDVPMSTDWEQAVFELEPGEQEIVWHFERLASLPPNGTGRAWIDELVVTPILNDPDLQEALDNDDHEIYSSERYDDDPDHSSVWTKFAKADGEGGFVAKSGNVPPGGGSAMTLHVEGPAVVSFDWGLYSDPEYPSELLFSVDGALYGYAEGTQDLHTRSFNLRPGPHSLKFEFNRNLDTSEEYGDPIEGYVDKLVVESFGESPDLADAVDRPSGVYGRLWQRDVSTHRDGSDSASVSAPLPLRSELLYIELPQEAGLLHFWTKTEADAAGTLLVYVDNDLIAQRSGAQGWAKTELHLPARTSPRLMEVIFHRSEDLDENSPDTKAYIDSVVFAPGATNYQPDLSIGPRRKRLRGEGIVNRNGARQIATIRTNWRRAYGQYRIGGRNTSPTDTDHIQLRGVGSRRHHKITFVVVDGKTLYDFTAAFLTGRLSTLELNPGGFERHEIWIVRKRKSKRRNYVLTTVGTSKADPRKVDVVKTRLSVKPQPRRRR